MLSVTCRVTAAMLGLIKLTDVGRETAKALDLLPVLAKNSCWWAKYDP